MTKKSESGSANKESPKTNIVTVNMNFGDGLEKLQGVFNNVIKAIKSGVGRWYEPIGRKRDAKADHDVTMQRTETLIQLTKKQAELADLRAKFGIDPDALNNSLGARALAYELEQSLDRQSHREELLEMLPEEIKLLAPANDTDTGIDGDWLSQFWRAAENVSREDVRRFFARLLAKEIVHPGSISPITLSVLSSLTVRAAKLFEQFCRMSIKEAENVFVIHPQVYVFQHIGPLDEFGITLYDLYELESFGLIRSAETMLLNFAQNQPGAPIDYAGIKGTLNFSGLQMHQLVFTRAGVELRELLPLTPIPAYTKTIQDKLKGALVLSG